MNISDALSDKFLVLTASLPFSRIVEPFNFAVFDPIFEVGWRTLDNDRSQLLPMEIQMNILVTSVII